MDNEPIVTTPDHEIPQTERVVNEDGTVTVIGYPSVGVRPEVGDGTATTVDPGTIQGPVFGPVDEPEYPPLALP